MASTEEIKKKQSRNLLIVIAVLAVAFICFYALVHDNKTKLRVQNQKTEFASPIKHIDAESALIEKTESRLLAAEKNNEELKKEVETLNKNNAEKDKDKAQDEIKSLNDKITELEKKVSGEGMSHEERQNFAGSIFPSAPGADTTQNAGQDKAQPLMMQGIRDDAVTADSNSLIPLKNPETYVPAGTFVRAVALGGADASAAVNAQSNPIPMLFRVIEDGTMPNNKPSHLKGCLATAAVVGDISSERGMIRLETLSCIDRDSNRITDMTVDGTVFGPEGKNGVRGTPVWRDGALLQRAFIAGTLSGLASGISQKYTTTSVSPLGATQTISNGDIFKYGAASGISNAMEKLADYNIQRAEQYHPVLQISAGTVVDLVFLKGFFLDGEKHNSAEQGDVNLHAVETAESNLNDSARNLPVLPFTKEQVARLKAHEAELNNLGAYIK